MYLKRKIDDFLINWKADSDKKPLIVKGARQIGKTESIKHFAYDNYENVIYINFVLEQKYKGITSEGYDVDSIIRNITIIDPSKKFIEGKTLIIFDELQEYPYIATSLKSFKIDGRYDVICSGSMLGINYKNIHSNSVGFKTDYEMYSMDFEEFLWAKDYETRTVDEILEHMIEMIPFSEVEMRVFQSLFLEYSVLGGMPDVVRTYIETKSFSGTLDIQKQIMLDYEEDVRKYAQGLDQAKILRVYRSIPAQLAKENKKFQYSKISHGGRSKDYIGCIDWLVDAGVVSRCYCMAYPELPIKGNVDEDKFKLYYPDTGLLISTIDEEAQEDLRANKNLGVYKGAIYENFVAEALLKQGLPLVYYKKENSTLEMDFFVQSADELIPVEVKAGKNSTRSLTAMIKNVNYSSIDHGIKFHAGNIGYADGVITMPYFCVFLLKKYIRSQKK